MVALAEAKSLSLKWIGISGFILSDETTTLIFDPAVTRVSPLDYLPFFKVQSDLNEVEYWLKQCEIKKVDAIFVNHAHTDHVIDAPTIQKKYNSKVYGNNSVLMILKGQQVDENNFVQLKPSQEVSLGAFKIKVFSTPHGYHFGTTVLMNGEISAPLDEKTSAWNYLAGETFSFSISHPEKTFLFQSVGKVPVPDVLANEKQDILLLTAINKGEGLDYINKRIVPSQAKTIIPLHHDNFFKKMRRDGEIDYFYGFNPQKIEQEILGVTREVEIKWPKYCKELL